MRRDDCNPISYLAPEAPILDTFELSLKSVFGVLATLTQTDAATTITTADAATATTTTDAATTTITTIYIAPRSLHERDRQRHEDVEGHHQCLGGLSHELQM